MLESTPGAPYDVTVSSLLGVEGNMRLRFVLPLLPFVSWFVLLD